MAYGTVQADVIGTSVAGANLGAGNASLMKNRIINGAMVISQRKTTFSDPADGEYTLDRWSMGVSTTGKLSVSQSSTAPTSFNNSLLVTSSSAYSVGSGDYFLVNQPIEGFNVADLGFGTASAKTVTLSFQVYSSLTGTFGGSLRNGAGNRSYPFTYTVSSANTWTTASVTIAGDTSGTWLTTNGIGIRVSFGLGVGSDFSGTAGAWAGANYASATGAVSVVGTSGATFYITGVQLEVGSSATGFEYRQYNTELNLCQRYCQQVGSGLTGIASSTTNIYFFPSYTMRTGPTATLYNTTIKVSDNYAADKTSSSSAVLSSSDLQQVGGRVEINGWSGLTLGRFYSAYGNTYGYFLILSAEL